jgi:calcineurin-like phosphoesterase family protein
MKFNQDYYKRRVMDVGCNMIGYTPISYDEVKKYMMKRSISKVDSHHE